MEGLVKREMLSARVRAIKPSGIRKFFDIAAAMPEVISLGVGEPDFVTPEHISQAGVAAIQQGMTHYTSNYGTLELRQAIATMLQQRYGVTYDPKTEVLVSVGVSEAIDATLRATIDPGDEVIIPDPGYVAYEADVTLAGGVTGYQQDNLSGATSASQPQVAVVVVHSGLLTIITLTGAAPASTFMQRWGADWSHILSAFQPGQGPASAKPCA